MARTQRDIADYFSHDAHASTGDTLTVLQSKYGNDGYAVWFKLLEKLTATDGHCIDCRNNVKWQVLIAYLGTKEITTVEILDLLVEMGNIDKDLWASKLIWCQKLVDNLADVYKNRKRELPQKPITTGSNPITTGSNPITTVDIPQRKGKESRVKESRVEESAGVRKPVTDPRIKQILEEITAFLGYPGKTDKNPIPNYPREGQFVKKMLARGFSVVEILDCWKAKLSQRGEYVSAHWVNEDIGKSVKKGGNSNGNNRSNSRIPEHYTTPEEYLADMERRHASQG